jgi:3-methyladenine DNA glycosylase AlkD
LRALRRSARTPSDHPASGGFGSAFARLGLTAAEVEAVTRDVLSRLRRRPPREAVRVAIALAASRTLEGRQVAYLLLNRLRAAAATLTEADLERLGRGNDNWVSVDTFACRVAGPAWRQGRVGDARVHRWARSRDRWWRRTALASTVALNVASRGGTGDPARTLALCAQLVDDHDDMVVKGMSWALRCLVPHDPQAVRAFLARHGDALAARARREVANKLRTGLKNPRGGRT